MIKIKKVKIKEGLTFVDYEAYSHAENGDMITSEVPFTSDAKPHRDFFKAFQDLKVHAINICELAPKIDKKAKDTHIVTTVTIKEAMGEDAMILISMNKYIKSGKCFSVTTPLIDLGSIEYDKLDVLNAEILILKSEAEAFINGKNGNQQMSIDFLNAKEVVEA